MLYTVRILTHRNRLCSTLFTGRLTPQYIPAPHPCGAPAIDALQSPWVRVDLPNVHTNILIIEMLSEDPSERRSPTDFAARLGQVSPAELSDKNVRDADGRPIVVQVSARDWKFARLVVYHQINDEAVDLIIKKLVYCVREWDAAGQPKRAAVPTANGEN